MSYQLRDLTQVYHFICASNEGLLTDIETSKDELKAEFERLDLEIQDSLKVIEQKRNQRTLVTAKFSELDQLQDELFRGQEGLNLVRNEATKKISKAMEIAKIAKKKYESILTKSLVVAPGECINDDPELVDLTLDDDSIEWQTSLFQVTGPSNRSQTTEHADVKPLALVGVPSEPSKQVSQSPSEQVVLGPADQVSPIEGSSSSSNERREKEVLGPRRKRLLLALESSDDECQSSVSLQVKKGKRPTFSRRKPMPASQIRRYLMNTLSKNQFEHLTKDAKGLLGRYMHISLNIVDVEEQYLVRMNSEIRRIRSEKQQRKYRIPKNKNINK